VGQGGLSGRPRSGIELAARYRGLTRGSALGDIGESWGTEPLPGAFHHNATAKRSPSSSTVAMKMGTPSRFPDDAAARDAPR
jgi:hypothetical protein